MKTWYKITDSYGWGKYSSLEQFYRERNDRKKLYEKCGKEYQARPVKRIIKITEEDIEVPEDLK